MRVISGKCNFCVDEHTRKVGEYIAKEHPDWSSYDYWKKASELKRLHNLDEDFKEVKPEYKVIVLGEECIECGGVYVCKKHLEQAIEKLNNEEVSPKTGFEYR